ncbi:glycosyltransferase family 2 protein [Patescibacteria group bacterium]|nr:glycosyltransferase family 2 protein [Patescibacteria group bacterium]
MNYTHKLSIAVLSWNTRRLTKNCLTSIKKNVKGVDYEVILIDNNSRDGSDEMVEENFPWVKLIKNESNEGFAKGNNQAFEAAGGKYFLLLNSDTEISVGSIENMVAFLDKKQEFGAVTGRLMNLDQTTQYYMHRRFPNYFSLVMALIHKKARFFKPQIVKDYLYLDKDFKKNFEVEQAAAACLMLRSDLVSRINGLLDEKNFPIYYNDVDLCYRLRQIGSKIACLAIAPITHIKGQSIKKLDFSKGMQEYVASSLRFFSKFDLRFDYWMLKFTYMFVFSGVLIFSLAQLILKRIKLTEIRRRWEILKQATIVQSIT